MEYHRIVRSILFVVPGRGELIIFRRKQLSGTRKGCSGGSVFRLLVFDLADTVFMDSAGVGMMIGLYRGNQGMGRCCLYHSHAEQGFGGFTGWPGLHKIIPCYEDEAQFFGASGEGGGAGDEDKCV